MFNIITCEDCGFTGFFARPEARKKLSTSDKWEKYSPAITASGGATYFDIIFEKQAE